MISFAAIDEAVMICFVYQLRNFLGENHRVVNLSYIDLRLNLRYIKWPVAIIGMREKVLRKVFPLVLVSRDVQSPGESIWEHKDDVCRLYPYCSSN